MILALVVSVVPIPPAAREVIPLPIAPVALASNDGTLRRVSVSSSGAQANSDTAFRPSISADGRYVAFASSATNLVLSDANGAWQDIFVRDRQAGTTSLVSVSSTREQSNSYSDEPVLSPDGRWVVFISRASNLVPGDTNGTYDVFIHDMITGETRRVSVGPRGEEGWGPAIGGRPSADGRYVVFATAAYNIGYGFHIWDRASGVSTRLLVTQQTGWLSGWFDASADARYVVFTTSYALVPEIPNYSGAAAYLYDRALGELTLVSRTPSGRAGNMGAELARVSDNGKWIVFKSWSSDLVEGDTNSAPDIFLFDVASGAMRRVSVSATGVQANNWSDWPDISGDGSTIAFQSYATNLDVVVDRIPKNDVFVVDRATGKVVRASVSTTGGVANDHSEYPSLNGDGSVVAFTSLASNLVPGDTNGRRDAFVFESAGNAVPLVNAGSDRSVFAGQMLEATGAFIDNDPAQTWTATIDYGDGSGAVPLPLVGQMFAITHTYARAGSYTVTVVVTDSVGASGHDEMTVTVTRRPLIYVPGLFGSELGTGPSTGSGPCDPVWLNFCEAAKPGRETYFDRLKFDPGGVAPTDPTVVPTGRLLKVPGSDAFPTLRGGYEEVEKFFMEQGGYTRDRDLFIFAFDWRFPSAITGAHLDRRVSDVLASTGASSVDIVAHSLGGLAARWMLVNGSQRDHVARAVFLGAPELGTPVFAFVAIKGDCLPVQGGFCLISSEEVREVARTIPSGAELSPSREYYRVFPSGGGADHPAAYVDQRLLAEGEPDILASFDVLQAREREAGVTPALLPAAESFHADDRTWPSQIPSTVKLTLVAGTGVPTIGQLIERRAFEHHPVYDGPLYAGERVVVVDRVETRAVDGDGYVVVQSAALSETIGTPVDTQLPNVTRLYAYLGHILLTLHEGLPISLALVRDEDPVAKGLAYREPRQPSGVILSSHSPVELLVSDAAGHRVGSPNGNDVFSEVDGAAAHRFGGTRVITLPSGGTYAIAVHGTGDGDATIRVRPMAGGAIARQWVFSHVPVRSVTLGTFSVDATGAPTAMSVDVDGDGAVDQILTATQLSGAAADDLVPPAVAIDEPSAGQAVVGSFRLAWTATDPASGIAESFAVIDIDGPQVVVPAPGMSSLLPGTHRIDALAEDRAGNVNVARVTLTALSHAWLMPLDVTGRMSIQAGGTIPVRFTIHGPDGGFVRDESVRVELVDGDGSILGGPLAYGRPVAGGVAIQGDAYHGNLSTRGIAPGAYILRVTFRSATLVGSFDLPLTLR